MTFPACRHRKTPSRPLRPSRSFTDTLVWLGSEPYRLFFLSGIVFSIAGVAMWPLFYSGHLSVYPAASHARVMIEAFGGAFVVGFLGTAGPRMLSAPRLTPWEVLLLLTLQIGCGISHLVGQTTWGDACFLAMLLVLLLALGRRFFGSDCDAPPPPMLLAVTGLLCGIIGVSMWLNPACLAIPGFMRLAGLFLYQGFLLGPVMGVGVFLFPRLLGGDFGEPSSDLETRRSFQDMATAAVALVASFAVEIWINPMAGQILRTATFVFALAHVRWRRAANAPSAGTLANTLRIWCLPLAVAGLILPAFFFARHVALTHLLFIGGFGLLCLIAGSRVLFGHSGSLAQFAERSWIARSIVAAVVLAAFTRVSADFLPRVMVSHYEYAAWLWGMAAAGWAIWHARRFFKKDSEAE